MKRALLLLVLLLGLSSPLLASVSRAESPPSPAEARAEIRERVSIRARGRSHGELRVLRRGPAIVLQTLLVTRTLSRVASRIREKEETHWPEGSWGQAESRRYREALAAAVASVLAGEKSDRNRRLLIELRLAPGSGEVTFAAPLTRREPAGLRIVSTEELSELTPSCRWVRREIELVAADRGVSLVSVSPLPSC